MNPLTHTAHHALAAARLTALACAAMVVTSAAAQVKPAMNDAQATFDRGLFLLPVPANAKDVYTLILERADGKVDKIALPAGSTALRLVDAALPPVAWKWRYAVQRTELGSIDVVEPTRATVSYSGLLRYGNAVSLNWKMVPGAKTYRVTTKTAPEPTALEAKPDWGSPSSIDLSAEEATNEARRVGFYDLPLKPSTRVEWTVTALDGDDQPMARSSPMVLGTGASWSEELSRKGWKFQRSDTLNKDDAGKPALFGYASNQKAGDATRSTAYQAEFAIIWNPKTGGDRLWWPQGSVEARLHSRGADKDDDALNFRVGAYRIFSGVPGQLTTNLKYETESKLDTKKALFELAYTPLFSPFSQYFPLANDSRRNAAGNLPPDALPSLQWAVQFTLGADLGKTLSVGTSQEVRKTNFRQHADLRLDAQLNFLADMLRIPQVTLYATSRYWHLSREQADEYTYSTTGISFQLTKEVSLEATYAVGADAPKFTFSRSGLVGLGFKF